MRRTFRWVVCELSRSGRIMKRRIPNWIKNRLRTIRQRSHRKHLEFNLSPDDIYKLKLTKTCLYCGKFLTKKTTTIDRFDNRQGYIRNNCVTACSTCNHAKDSMSVIRFLEEYIWPKIEAKKDYAI